ncbi:hypothetical protein GCM10009720_18520 [Yaniella flava]|uniref:Uncharacterized protein n=1 Tax=Yaniella flava TaxID=287930 RepID=A0ABP5G3I6_9MICC
MSLTSEIPDAQQTHDHWHSYINQRLDRANTLLETISTTIETVDPHNREHAADLLDAAIQNLQRLHDRFGPPPTQDDPDNPPF